VNATNKTKQHTGDMLWGTTAWSAGAQPETANVEKNSSVLSSTIETSDLPGTVSVEMILLGDVGTETKVEKT